MRYKRTTPSSPLATKRVPGARRRVETSGAWDVGASLGHHATHQTGRSSEMLDTHATGDAPRSHRRTVASEELMSVSIDVPCSHNTPISSCLDIEDPALVPLQCRNRMAMELPPDGLHIVHSRRPVIRANEQVIRIRCIRRRETQRAHWFRMFCGYLVSHTRNA